jgi:hypothetical protein
MCKSQLIRYTYSILAGGILPVAKCSREIFHFSFSTFHYALLKGGSMGDNFLDAANGEAVRLTVIVGRVAGSTVEVQEVTVSTASLRTAPAIPVRAMEAGRTIGGVTEARSREEDAPNATSSRWQSKLLP